MVFTSKNDENVKNIYVGIFVAQDCGVALRSYESKKTKKNVEKCLVIEKKYCILERLWYNIWYHRENVYLYHLMLGTTISARVLIIYMISILNGEMLHIYLYRIALGGHFSIVCVPIVFAKGHELYAETVPVGRTRIYPR